MMQKVRESSAGGFLLAVLILTVLWLLFFWRILLAGDADRQIFPIGDFTQHYYAFSQYQADRFAQGQFPLWNPYNHAGDTFIGNIQFVAFYPPRLLAMWLAADNWSVETYQTEIAFHYLLASLFMLAFLRASTRKPLVALVGSIIYAYSGYLTGYPMLQPSILEAIVWLPLVMLGIHWSMERPGWAVRGMCLAGVALAVSLLGGHPQTSMQVGYLAVAYLVLLGWWNGSDWRHILGRLALFGIVTGGLAAVQLLPALEFTRLSYRVTSLGYADKAGGFSTAEFLHVLWPSIISLWSPLYIGVAGLLLLIGALVQGRLPGVPHRGFWVGVIIVSLFLSLGGNGILFDLFYLVVPGFAIFRQQERAASLVVFAAVVLAAQFLAALFDPAQRGHAGSQSYRRTVYSMTGLFVAVNVLAWIYSALAGDEPSDAAAVFGHVAIIALLFAAWLHSFLQSPDPDWKWAVPLVFLIVIDLFTIGTRSENFVADVPQNRPQIAQSLAEYSQIPPEAIRWRVDGAAGIQGDGVLFRVPDIYGTGPFSLETIEELRRIPTDRFWEVLAVRYVSTQDEPPETVSLELLAYDLNSTGQEFRVFELQDPRPLTHLVYDNFVAQGSPEFARQYMADPRVNLRETSVTLEALPVSLPGERPELSRVDDFQIHTPEFWSMRVSTGGDALLTLSLVKYPGWTATVDEQPVEIVDTYAGLIGIPIRAGEDQLVEVRFQPTSLRVGLIITAVTGILTLMLALFAPRLERRLGAYA